MERVNQVPARDALEVLGPDIKRSGIKVVASGVSGDYVQPEPSFCRRQIIELLSLSRPRSITHPDTRQFQ